MSNKDMVMELLEIAEITENGTVSFNNRAKEIIMDLAEEYRKTPVYKRAKEKMPEWVNKATAAEIYVQMCGRIAEAPTILHMFCSTKVLIPILWQKIQEEEGKVYIRKMAAIGKSDRPLEVIFDFLEENHGSS